MTRLEDIKAGVSVRGIAPEGTVEVVSVEWYGDGAIQVIYREGGGAVKNRLLYRDEESSLSVVASGNTWSFDGDGAMLRLVSEAMRIRLGYLFDSYLAIHTSRIEALPHQITAVYGEMLRRQPLRFLLADDPGAGKTIMTGLLIKELVIRGDLERCLIVAPGNLVEQWQDELTTKFGLSFAILSRDQLETSGTGNPFEDQPLLIARLDMLSRNEELQARLAASQDHDLVVVDEAHKMSASYTGGEVKYTKRYHLGEALGEHARHFLLLSATPHNGKQDDFELFMALLDADRFEGRTRARTNGTDAGAHAARTPDSAASAMAKEILALRGSSPRLYKNTLVFLAPDRQRVKDLEGRVRQLLARTSINEEAEALNVTPVVARQAETKRREAEMSVSAQVGETWTWCLVPEQLDPMGEVEWNEVRLAGGEGLASRASKKLVNEELLLPVFGSTRLRMELDRTLWRDRNHIGIKELWNHFCSYLYLPRLRDREVLLRAVQEGTDVLIESDSFAFAEGYDEEKGRYVGLRMGGGGSVVMDSSSLLIKPEIARRQPEPGENGGTDGGNNNGDDGDGGTNGKGGPRPQTLPKRFYASATLDADRVGRDAGRIADEVLTHLATLSGSRLRISIEIEAEMPEGAPEHVQRTVSENARVLKFDTQGFEPE